MNRNERGAEGGAMNRLWSYRGETFDELLRALPTERAVPAESAEC